MANAQSIFIMVRNVVGGGVKEISIQKLAELLDIAALGLAAADIKTLYESNSDTNEFSDAEQTKLSGIETSATADQTGAEIKSAYEGEANAYTDTKNTKLAGIETSATADQTAAELRALGFFDTSNDGAASLLDADLLDGAEGAAFGKLADANTWALAQTFTVPPVVPSFTVSGAPSASPAAQIGFCTDETGGAVLCFSDNTNWLRSTDRAVIA